jgi:hypothetical protein
MEPVPPLTRPLSRAGRRVLAAPGAVPDGRASARDRGGWGDGRERSAAVAAGGVAVAGGPVLGAHAVERGRARPDSVLPLIRGGRVSLDVVPTAIRRQQITSPARPNDTAFLAGRLISEPAGLGRADMAEVNGHRAATSIAPAGTCRRSTSP